MSDDTPTPDPSESLLDKIPEKFRADSLEASIEKLVGSYGEAEKKLGERKEVPKFDSRDDLLKAAGLTMEDLSSQWIAEGKLDDATYQKFESVGVPRFLVDQTAYVEAQQAALLNETVYATGGGKERTTTLLEWARTGAPEELRTKYDTAYTSRDIAGTREAMTELADFYNRAMGVDGSGEIRGGDIPAPPSAAFKDYAEKSAASKAVLAGQMDPSEYSRRLNATIEKNPRAMREPQPISSFGGIG